MLPRVQQTFLDQAGYLPILAETFLTARKAEGLSAGSLKYYREKISMFLAWCEAQAVTQLQDVTPDLLRRFLLAMAETHNAGGVHGIYRGVRAFLRFIEAEEVIPEWRSPTRKVKAPRVELEPIEGVSLADVSALLGTCNLKEFTGARDSAMLLALLDTGARVTEFLSVDLADVGPDGSITLRHTKAKKPRNVFLSTKTRRALRAWLRMRRDRGRALWVTIEGDRMTYDGLRGVLTRRARLTGLAQTPSPHDFRRAFAISFLRSGGDIFSLAAILGHKGIEILKRYLALTDQDAQSAHARHSPIDHLKG
jgi:site-specific recombinase XerD